MSKDAAELELYNLLQEEQEYQNTHKFYSTYPDEGEFARHLYPKHIEFFGHGAKYDERGLLGGNGTGKTVMGCFELTAHLSGEYPHWWTGRRFDNPISAWAAGDNWTTVREIIQQKLLGDVAKLGKGALGTGMIPRHLIDGDIRFVPNTNYAVDFVRVRHRSGGYSVVAFKAYEQGRHSFQGTEKHVILLDEEPPRDVYDECVMRGRTVGGIILATFTPLKGFTDVVGSFLNWEEETRRGGSKIMVQCSWDDVPHLDEDWKRKKEASLLPYERDARMRGIPSAGVGRIYPIEDDAFVIKPIALPPHWRRCFGFDGGWHNTAAVWGAYDKDEDVLYIYSEYKRGEQSVDVHAAALKARGAWIPGVGDCTAREGHTNDQLLDLYKARGVKLRPADKALDAGIQDVYARLTSGKLKVFSTCQKWLDEFRMYAYDEKQKVVKRNDHLMDATRFIVRSGLQVAVPARQEYIHIPEIQFG